MKTTDFVVKAKQIANGKNTIYILGCFGAPMNAKNIKRYTNNNLFNASRAQMIQNCTSDTFGFDCVGLIKGILWGWNGNTNHTYGGATYKANGVGDLGANGMIGRCLNVSTNFNKIDIGEVVWMDGHIGIYIGSGLAIECTPKWDNKVQITAVGNIGSVNGYHVRTWTKHGKLPWIDYSVLTNGSAQPKEDTSIIKIYVVKKGDTLWGIAQKQLGNGNRYKEIMSLNKLTTTLITPNQVLKIPSK